MVKPRSTSVSPSRSIRSIRVVRVMPRQDRVGCRWRDEFVVFRDDPGVAGAALADVAVRAEEPGFLGARFCASSLARLAGRSMTVLMSQRPQRMSGMLLIAIPFGGRGVLAGAGGGRARQTTVGGVSTPAKKKLRGPAPRETCR